MLTQAILACAALAFASSSRAVPPETPKRPVSDQYQGVKVSDDYRWLEDWDSPEVRTWSDAQNAYARSVLDALPSAAAIRARVTELRKSESPDYFDVAWANNRFFALKSQPPKQQPMLVVMDSPDHPEAERVLVDPNEIDAKGTTAIDFFVPSLDGKMVAVSLSEGGSESGTVYVYDVESAKRLGDVIPRVNGGTAGGSLSWNADGTAFLYTRYPRGTERPPQDMDFYQQVSRHILGTPTDDDRLSTGKDFPRIAEVQLQAREDGLYSLASVANGDGGEFAHYLFDQDRTWHPVSAFADKVIRAKFGEDETLDLLSRKDSPRGRLVEVVMGEHGLGKPKTIVPESDAVIEDYLSLRGHLLVNDLVGGVSRVRVFERGALKATLAIGKVSSVGQMVKTGPREAMVRTQTYLNPPAWYRVGMEDMAPKRTALAASPRADYSDCEVIQETAISKDNTKVPLTIIRRKGTRLDGSNPTLLYGYGGFGISETPRYSDVRKVWLEQGGVWVVANIRGGGEFGEEWHTGGNLTNKQNCFDDFHAAMQRLVELKYTNRNKLALMGGSNGGLLMGAMITQHPGEFRAAVSAVGIYDMLRVELSSNGAFNVTEYGTVKDPEQFKAMYAYSPYHNVKDGAVYPSVLFMTGANDPRVDPMQSRKMTARLQGATKSAGPILLRTTASAGHGIGSSLSEQIEEDVDRFAFLFHELGVDHKPMPN
jgi:prolyl oligopeptidase